MYSNGYSPKEAFNGDAFADKKAAMAVVGPWAIAVYGDKVNWGVVPVPTKDGARREPGLLLHRREEHRPLLRVQEPEDRLGRGEVRDQQGPGRQLLEKTGQMPIRTDLPTTYADYFSSHPEYKMFADQASRTVEVPNVPNSVEIWQEIRDNYSSSVIFGKTSIDDAIAKAAAKADELAGQS